LVQIQALQPELVQLHYQFELVIILEALDESQGISVEVMREMGGIVTTEERMEIDLQPIICGSSSDEEESDYESAEDEDEEVTADISTPSLQKLKKYLQFKPSPIFTVDTTSTLSLLEEITQDPNYPYPNRITRRLADLVYENSFYNLK